MHNGKSIYQIKQVSRLEIDRHIGLADIWADIWVLPIYRYRPKQSIIDKTLLYSYASRQLAQESTRKQVKTVILQHYQVRFINKQTRLTMERASAIADKTKASSGSCAMFEARCCVWIHSRYTSGSFRSTKSL